MDVKRMSLEQARELRSSAVWGWVKMELDYRIHCKLQDLRNCDEARLRLMQQELFLLETLKRLPDDVVDREDTGSTRPK